MRFVPFVHAAALAACMWGLAAAGEPLAENGATRYAVVVATDASAPERHAADELARFLGEATGAVFPVATPEAWPDGPALVVGPGAARALLPALPLAGLGDEGFVLHSDGDRHALTGGPDSPRGTLYAVYDFLERVAGVRWWTFEEMTVPRHATLAAPGLAVREVPVFEYREPFYFDAFDPDWAVRNKANGQHFKLDAARGGRRGYAEYEGRAYWGHTFWMLVPSDPYFARHPEWFALLGGKRAPHHQLCLTNAELLAFVIDRAKTILAANPPDVILSVSQNDGGGQCQCEPCRAVEAEEGSASGPILRFVNAVADAVRDDFPRAAVDTFAYTYSRTPPRVTRPRDNVIVRLCSMHCGFGPPLDSEANRAFSDDLKAWSTLGGKLYVWDYATNFAAYFLPHPNLRSAAPNLRFFAEHNVKGVFEQGVFHTRGGDLPELRAWLLAKLLWNPALDPDALVREFAEGYYGPAAPGVLEYIRIVHDEAARQDAYVGMNGYMTAGYLNADTLPAMYRALAGAAEAVADDPVLSARLRRVMASVHFAVLAGYGGLTRDLAARGEAWPFAETPEEMLAAFKAVCAERGVTALDELGNKPEAFAPRLVAGSLLPPPTPAAGLPGADWKEVPLDAFRLHMPGSHSDLKSDPKAAGGIAAWMPGWHSEWALQFAPPDGVAGEWTLYLSMRLATTEGYKGYGVDVGVYDFALGKGVAGRNVGASELTADDYRWVKIAAAPMTPSTVVYLNPLSNPDQVKDIFVDRAVFIRRR